MAGVFELAGTYKIGNGGMTSFARAILGEYRGHMVFETTVKEIRQSNSAVEVITKLGHSIKAIYLISTIPL
jgi:lysyl oxidase-like protein 2/3/4